MTEVRELLERMADGPAPPSPIAADQVYAAGRRRHRRRRRMVVGGAAAALALAAIAAVGATTVVTAQPRRGELPADRGTSVVRGEPHPGTTGAAAIIQWAGAADAEHLYLAYLHCADSPCRKDTFDLVGSNDGGQTWSARSTVAAAYGWQVLGPGTLLATGPADPRVSVDGGRTWSDLTAGTAAEAVPPGGAVTCWSADGQTSCGLYAVDPATGRIAPLATQPALKLEPGSVKDVGGRLWVTGIDRMTGRPAAAVSTDRGRTWSTQVFTEPAGSVLDLATADGRTVYAMVGDVQARERIVYRRSGGDDWQRLDTGDVPYGRGMGWSFVAADGSHVICELGERDQDVDKCQFWAANGAAGYRRVELDGLPAAVDDVERTPDGWFYTASYGPTRILYGSADGRRWSPVTVQ